MHVHVVGRMHNLAEGRLISSLYTWICTHLIAYEGYSPHKLGTNPGMQSGYAHLTCAQVCSCRSTLSALFSLVSVVILPPAMVRAVGCNLAAPNLRTYSVTETEDGYNTRTPTTLTNFKVQCFMLVFLY